MEEDLLTEIETVKPKTKVKSEVKPVIFEEKQVIVHCTIPCEFGMGIRIWRTTYLVTENDVKIPLIFWKNVSLAPTWTPIFTNDFYHFTLIFGGLPKSCKIFSLVEKIPEAGGFEVKNISRNKTDVYEVMIE